MKNMLRLLLTAAFAAGMASLAAADPCAVPDNGTGTVDLPPAGCEYLSPDEVHMIINGLPPNTTIRLAPIHRDFICLQGAPGGFPGCPPPGLCEAPGGDLGGNVDCFQSQLAFEVEGTGDLTGFVRTLQIPTACQVYTGPRTPGQAEQDFDNEMFILQGDLFGDPDFAQLSIQAGRGLGLPPSLGETTLTRVGPPGSHFQVDSFFDIEYRIDFQGAPGGQLDGMGGTTTGTIRMQAGVETEFLPAANVWGQIALTLLVLGTGVLVLQRRLVA